MRKARTQKNTAMFEYKDLVKRLKVLITPAKQVTRPKEGKPRAKNVLKRTGSSKRVCRKILTAKKSPQRAPTTRHFLANNK